MHEPLLQKMFFTGHEKPKHRCRQSLFLPLAKTSPIRYGIVICCGRRQSFCAPGNVPENHAALASGTSLSCFCKRSGGNDPWFVALLQRHPKTGGRWCYPAVDCCLSRQCANDVGLPKGKESDVMAGCFAPAAARAFDLVGLSIHKANGRAQSNETLILVQGRKSLKQGQQHFQNCNVNQTLPVSSSCDQE